ncbi:MAG: CatB-related O-acetyltransferase [Candidatus Staskawiczbacteria bacterium]|nr:CatB-related O-acetyltransferase [Candidatus Staskawiczbacteria bacterium]
MMYYSILTVSYYVVFAGLAVFLILLRTKKIKVVLNYRTLFFIGLALMPIGILSESSAFLVLSPIYMLFGLVNADRWGRNQSGKSGSIVMGAHSYGDPKIRVWKRENAVVTIGKYCSIADNVRFIIDGNRNFQLFSTFPFLEKLGWKECESGSWGKENPTVGNDVWIGSDVVIYSGVHIGDGAVIAGQSIVTKSVPPYALVAGNPAVIKKYRFEAPVIETLLKHKWWDLPEQVIREKIMPCAADIQKVCQVLEELIASR